MFIIAEKYTQFTQTKHIVQTKSVTTQLGTVNVNTNHTKYRITQTGFLIPTVSFFFYFVLAESNDNYGEREKIWSFQFVLTLHQKPLCFEHGKYQAKVALRGVYLSHRFIDMEI